MDNRAFERDTDDIIVVDTTDPPPYSEFSLVHDEMEALRQRLEPGVFNAPLSHGQMRLSDMYKLMFLITFPTFFFLLAIVIMGEND